jgi:hypothetical protein
MSDSRLRDVHRHSLLDRFSVQVTRDCLREEAMYEARDITMKVEGGCEVMDILHVWEPYTPIASALADALRAFVEETHNG